MPAAPSYRASGAADACTTGTLETTTLPMPCRLLTGAVTQTPPIAAAFSLVRASAVVTRRKSSTRLTRALVVILCPSASVRCTVDLLEIVSVSPPRPSKTCELTRDEACLVLVMGRRCGPHGSSGTITSAHESAGCRQLWASAYFRRKRRSLGAGGGPRGNDPKRQRATVR